MNTKANIERVLETALEAEGNGTPVLEAIQETHDVSRPTAERYLHKLRASGRLGFSQRKSSEVLEAVAIAIGVSAEVLRAAVIEHAGGDLRIPAQRVTPMDR